MTDLKTLIFVVCFCVLTSFQKSKLNYTFTISTDSIAGSVPKNVTITIINNESDTIHLTNLVFEFDIDDDVYWGTISTARFLDKSLVLKPNQQFNKTLMMPSLDFTDNKLEPVVFGNLAARIKISKECEIHATVSDFRLLENPLASSSLRYSNYIHIKGN